MKFYKKNKLNKKCSKKLLIQNFGKSNMNN